MVVLWPCATPYAASAALAPLTAVAGVAGPGGAGPVLAAAAVGWADGDPPRVRTGGPGVPDGLFWGWVLGELFYVPLLQAARGSAGDRAAPLRGVGLDDVFVNRARDAVVPGTSALLAVLRGGVEELEEVWDAVAAEGVGSPITTVVAPEEAAVLAAALAP